MLITHLFGQSFCVCQQINNLKCFSRNVVMELLKTLIISSEKAANIARLLRMNEKLFRKLVEQKSTAEANPRFREDFKTLADVLIQEMIKHDVGLKFPEMRERVLGEENNRFYSSELKKDIIVEVKETKEETALLLYELLDDEEIANILAAEVHKLINLEEINTKIPSNEEIVFGIDQLGIWIDPIDGTNEYVNGTYEDKTGDLYSRGLKCVTVLIGVFDNDGQPVMGIINQPFFEKGVDKGFQCHWGVCIQQNDSVVKISSIDSLDLQETNTICIGGNETELSLETLKEGGYNLVVSRGAGYKLLTVVLGIADAYVLSKPTTFFWDTCSPQAILKSLDGNIVEMAGVKSKEKRYLSYRPRDDNSKCNTNGIIAYRNEKVLDRLLELNWAN